MYNLSSPLVSIVFAAFLYVSLIMMPQELLAFITKILWGSIVYIQKDNILFVLELNWRLWEHGIVDTRPGPSSSRSELDVTSKYMGTAVYAYRLHTDCSMGAR